MSDHRPESISETADPFQSEEYQRFVESLVPRCRCSSNRPCDGVLAGGLCDDIQDEDRESIFDSEDEI